MPSPRPASILGLVALLSGCNPFGPSLTTMCEVELKKRLLAPSAYIRIDVAENDEAIPAEEYRIITMRRLAADPDQSEGHQKLQLKLLDLDLQQISERERSPTRYERSITFDSPNAYGVPIRSTSQCEYMSDDGRIDDLVKFLLTIDGETTIDYFARLAAQATKQ